MMDISTLKLVEQNCVPCRGRVPAVTEAEMTELLMQLPQWSVVQETADNGATIKMLRRVFKFSSYTAALTFTNQIAALAEEENHHPAILLEWGKVTVSWWTHTIDDLHQNDFVGAAKTEQVYEMSGQ
ncbi:MAG: 4a-hydroxytetrahydrobiopterin dehydratase [Chloroflexota bacterium]